MDIKSILALLGGLALFLYGMQMMSVGLEAAAGNRMKMILEKITANRIVGVLVGALITAVIQSSSATTVMVVGFVNSGMMTLQQAVWIIMGANIGTTITGQLIALNVGELAPLLAFLGVVAIVFIKNEKLKHIGEILAGLGVLFIGMGMMGAAMKPLAADEHFVGLLTKFQNPLLGILAGTVFTAIIQSSSASVGILQALANSGAIGLHSAAFVLFGQNIGTCITAFLAAIGTDKNAKRTTIIHIMFNVFGTVVFTILCLTTPLIATMIGLTPDNPSAQIANLHTIFNIVTTLLLLPLGTYLPRLAHLILPGEDRAEKEGMKTLYLFDSKLQSKETLGISMIYMEGIRKELSRMLSKTEDNVRAAFSMFHLMEDRKALKKEFESIEDREDYVDFLEKEISKNIIHGASFEHTESGGQLFNSLFYITNNIERIGDHAMNIAEYAYEIKDNLKDLPDSLIQKIDKMQEVCADTFAILSKTPDDFIHWHERVAAMEQKIDDMKAEYKNSIYKGMREGKYHDESIIAFSDMLTDFERIGDHALNIAGEMLKMEMIKNK